MLPRSPLATMAAAAAMPVPFNSFSEFNNAEGGDIWFALEESRPLVLRRHLGQLDLGPKGEGGRDHQRPLRLPETEPNAEVGAIHTKARAGDPDDTVGGRGLDDCAG